MDNKQLIGHCTEVLQKLGVSLRYSKLSDPEITINPGLCRLGGKTILFLDQGMSEDAQLKYMIDALAGLDTQGIFIPPVIREMIDSADRS